MLETLMITFREGLEAFLVVAIMIAYLANTGRNNLLNAVYAGIVVAILISATTGWHIAELAEDPVWEGVLALTAGVLVFSFTIYVMRTAKNIRQNIADRVEQHVRPGGALAAIGVFAFTVLMVAREGMETALMLGTISSYNEATSMWIGAVAGFALVGVIAYLWSSQSNKINLKLFMQVTGIFLVLFSVHLFILGIHELSEVEVLPLVSAEIQHFLHVNTEFAGHDSPYAQAITYSLILVPFGWLGLSYLREKLAHGAPTAAE